MRSLQEQLGHLGLADKFVFAPADLMGAIDLFVMTSNNEGFGHVIIEAMAARRPIIASDVGGIPDIVQEGITGRLVPAGEPEGFARAICELVASPEAMSMMGAKGRKRVDIHFSDATQLPSVLKIYKRRSTRHK